MANNAFDRFEEIGSGLLSDSIDYRIPAPLHLPVIEQMFNDIYDDRYKLGTFNQVRWLQGQMRKRRWRGTVDHTYDRMGVVIVEKIVELTAFQAGQLQKEYEHSVTLRHEADRLILYNHVALETEFARLNEHARLQRAHVILQAQVDTAAEKLRQEYGLKAGAQSNTHLTDSQIRQHQHEMAMKNRELRHEIEARVSAAGQTQDVLTAIGFVNRELDAINALTNEDEKHRRFTILHGSLGFMLSGSQK